MASAVILIVILLIIKCLYYDGLLFVPSPSRHFWFAKRAFRTDNTYNYLVTKQFTITFHKGNCLFPKKELSVPIWGTACSHKWNQR